MGGDKYLWRDPEKSGGVVGIKYFEEQNNLPKRCNVVSKLSANIRVKTARITWTPIMSKAVKSYIASTSAIGI